MGERRRTALVTGASRGIGAETAKLLAIRGYHVVVNYREKRSRALKVVNSIVQQGGSASVVGADVTVESDVEAMLAEVRVEHGGLDALVLNASGGLELGAEPGYPMRVNHDAQVALVDAALPLMSRGSRLVFVTSHQAHFVASRDVPAGYVPIAVSKRAGEDSIRGRQEELSARGVALSVVSGDMIDGTIIVRLLERRDREAVNARREVSGLPSIVDFAAAIAAEADCRATAVSRTVFVGGSDYLGS